MALGLIRYLMQVNLLYTSWLDDGTITPDMLKAGRAGTDADEPKSQAK